MGNSLHEGLGSVSYPVPGTMVTQRPLLPFETISSFIQLGLCRFWGLTSLLRVLSPWDATTHDWQTLHLWSLTGSGISCPGSLDIFLVPVLRPVPGSEPILPLVPKEVRATLNRKNPFATCCKLCYVLVLPLLCRKCSSWS